MLKVKSLLIENFRRFEKNTEIEIGNKLTLIVGQNATSKSTLLGMICQPFEFKAKYKVYTDVYDEIDKSATRTIAGELFESDFSKVFRMSNKYDNPDLNKYTYHIKYLVDNENKSLVVNSEKRKDQKNNNVRFVAGETRKKGEGNYPHPVIYLGLNRLYPLANSKSLELKEDFNLSNEEREFYSRWQKSITVIEEDIVPEYVSTDTKEFLGCKAEDYDAEAISAGQDNLGQIITAVLSFKRLKEDLKDRYQGGLLLIDELDATMHVLAQEKLLDFLIYSAETFSLQIVCTTHSLKMIEICSREKKKDTEIVSLYRRGKFVKVANKATYDDIVAELCAIQKRKTQVKVTCLFEDVVAAQFFKYITKNKFNEYINIYSKDDKNEETCLPSDILLRLATKNIPEFSKIIFVLDGDKREEITNRHKRIVALPGRLALEKEMYCYLQKLDDADVFWQQELGGYNKQMCFRNHMVLNDNDHINNFKQWFASQKEYWGRGNYKLYKRWCMDKDNREQVLKFIDSFVKAFIQITSKKEMAKSIEKIIKDSYK